MLTIGNNQYRNLEEQVLQNQADIKYILEEAGVLNEFGIKVVGVVENEYDLPDPTLYEGDFGDAYAVGTEAPYTLYVWTREVSGQTGSWWFNIGLFPAPSTVPGPVGPQGIQGIQGVRGSLWYSQSGVPTNTTNVNNNDQAVDGITGDIYQFVNNNWQKTGNIKGPQGIQGIQGIQGNIGPVGPIGPQGPEGPAGQSIQFIGTVDNINQLPTPSSLARNSAYLVGTSAPYDIYLIIGDTTLEWINAGKFGGGTDVVIDGVSQTQVDISYIPKISVNYEIGEDTIVTSNGSEVTFTGLQTTGYNTNNEQIEGIGTIELPIASSSEIELSVTNNTLQANLTSQVWNEIESIVGDSTPVEVQITAPTTSTNGQLTEDQLNTLQSNSGAYLMFNNEIYRLQDVQHETGYLVYSHVGFDNISTITKIKCMTITISTRGWVLTEQEVGGGSSGPDLYAHDIFFRGKITIDNVEYVAVVGLNIITQRATSYTSVSNLASSLYALYKYNTRLPATGYVLNSTDATPAFGIVAILQSSSNSISIVCNNSYVTGYGLTPITSGTQYWNDSVRKLN